MCVMGEHRRRKDDLICSPLRKVVEIATSAAAGVLMMRLAMLLTIKTRRTMHGGGIADDDGVDTDCGVVLPHSSVSHTVPLKFRWVLHSSRFSSL